MGLMRMIAVVTGTIAAFAVATLASEPSPAIPAGANFGAALTLSSPTGLPQLLAAPERFERRAILLHGVLSDVCQKKGCWTILRQGDEFVRVRFRDYGFFLPKDAAGAEAFIEGMLEVRMLSERDARHYEAEARNGRPDEISGPQRELSFTASGVRLIGLD